MNLSKVMQCLLRPSVRNCLLAITLSHGMLVSAAEPSVETTSTEASANEAEQPPKEDLKKPVILEDLAYGNILFEYYRGNTIEALNAILVANERQQLPNHRQSAQLLSGVIYLDLGMLTHAQKIFNDLLSEQDLKTELLAKLEFYLGKLHYRQGDFTQAQYRLKRVVDALEASLKDECLIMLSNMALHADEKEQAKSWLAGISQDSSMAAFSRFNLGILWLREANLVEAEKFLNNIHPSYTEDKVIRSLQDKAKVALGYFYLSQKDYQKARINLRKVRLSSPSSNSALLGIGWSYLESGSYRMALSHWLELSKRDVRDTAVQEALLAVPFAYQKLDSMQLSLDNYLHASDVFQQQMDLIDELTQKVEQGDLIDRFIDKIVLAQMNDNDLFGNNKDIRDQGIQDSKLFGDKYDYYLFELISQHRFNENFRSYQKLGKLANLLRHWEEQLPIFDEILKANTLRFEEKIPLVERYLTEGAFDKYQQALAQLESDIQALKNNEKLHLLADASELRTHARISRLMEKVARIPDDMLTPEKRLKAKRAQGVFQWQLESGKVGKIWLLEKEAKQIKRILAEIQSRKGGLERARASAKVRFSGYQEKVDVGKNQLLGLRDKIQLHIRIQAAELKSQILAVLAKRRTTIDHYLLQSDLSVARLHEKAVVIPEID
ncbi:tetratricopeptide repeat protein [Aliikangiella coralliicola]|uniref:Uncharacterized protein n=1 Tax=Aliikangiella coralliicola TaxID=2592383 RepID=A0A545U556_9GAMM|nr:hypothetical protein [Aliikangiella coralliicola]TQV84543.1 hypothetical protein FLL46_23315 [Aliikangiella coralliicola]